MTPLHEKLHLQGTDEVQCNGRHEIVLVQDDDLTEVHESLLHADVVDSLDAERRYGCDDDCADDLLSDVNQERPVDGLAYLNELIRHSLREKLCERRRPKKESFRSEITNGINHAYPPEQLDA